MFACMTVAEGLRDDLLDREVATLPPAPASVSSLLITLKALSQS